MQLLIGQLSEMCVSCRVNSWGPLWQYDPLDQRISAEFQCQCVNVRARFFGRLHHSIPSQPFLLQHSNVNRRRLKNDHRRLVESHLPLNNLEKVPTRKEHVGIPNRAIGLAGFHKGTSFPFQCDKVAVVSNAAPNIQHLFPTQVQRVHFDTQEFTKVWGPSTWVLSTKRQLGAAFNTSDSSLKTSHPRAEASVVVCTGARSLNRDCFYSQNLTCVCSDCSQGFPSNTCLQCPTYTGRTLLLP